MGSGPALEVTDQRTAGSGATGGSAEAPSQRIAPFQVNDMIGRSSFKSSIYAVDDKVMYPDPSPTQPPLGELLREVKLHRARGGCLGAKSR